MSDDLDFSQPAPSRPAPAQPTRTVSAPAPAPQPVQVYNAAQAMAFFRAAGKPEAHAPGGVIFKEGDKAGFLKRDKMYLVVTGEVEMRAQDKVIATLKIGEVFGEMAAIAGAARTATATAKVQTTLLTLDDKQFAAALEQQPDFALSMMGVMNSRIRNTIARLQASRTLLAGAAKSAEFFDKKLLGALVKSLGEKSIARFAAGKTIMQEGSVGNVMYVVVEGKVAMSIKGGVVGRAETGGVFGEMALVDQGPRTATANAETDCALLAINREAFVYLVKTSPGFGAALLAGLASRALDLAARLP